MLVVGGGGIIALMITFMRNVLWTTDFIYFHIWPLGKRLSSHTTDLLSFENRM